jgi:antirestriction protein ArdC
MTKERFDIHQHITDKIVNAIERGARDFRLPWHRATDNIVRPVNIASKKAYRGVNVVELCACAEESGYSSGVWGTYKQWSEAGARKSRPRVSGRRLLAGPHRHTLIFPPKAGGQGYTGDLIAREGERAV